MRRPFLLCIFAILTFAGACVQETEETPLTDTGACEGGECLCADLTCEGSANTCEGNLVVLGQPDGMCNPETGTCEFLDLAVTTIDCTESGRVCQDGECVEAGDDDCADVSCEGTPASCEGNVAISAGPAGSCNPDTGMCEFPELPIDTQDCSETNQVCIEGRCIDSDQDLCMDVECPDTSASCDGNVLNHGTTFDCDGATGECIPAPGRPPTDCAEEGLVCVNAACVPRGTTSCEDIDLPGDGFTVVDAPFIENDTLFLSVSYSGGCEEHVFSSCFDAFASGGDNLRVAVNIGHDSNGDACEAIVNESLSFDLTELIEAWRAAPNPGDALDITVTGFRGVLTYP